MHTSTPASAAAANVAPTSRFSPRLSVWGGGQPLPEQLRRVIEQLSGYDLSDVRVYQASLWPARVGARAFSFGSDIHLSAGAEDALEHEAWHVVQQKQGRVRATGTVSFEDPRLGVVGLNGEESLEREAEAMGRMVRSLVRCGVHLRERASLRVVPIQRPVVQKSVSRRAK
jgi:hypothetical protein